MNEPFEVEVVEIENRVRDVPPLWKEERVRNSWGERWGSLVRGVRLAVWISRILWGVVRAIFRARRHAG